MGKGAARVLRAVLICLVALAIFASSALAASVAVKVNKKTKVYKTASTSAKSVTVPKNLDVTLKAVSNGWGRITYKGHTAYIPMKYLTLKNPVKAYAAKKATLYRSAGSDSIGTVSKGAVVYIVGVNGSYARVTNKAGTSSGYIKASCLSKTRPSATTESSGDSNASAVPESLRSTTTSKSDSKIEYTIFVAQNLIGAPYSASAEPPKTFDCAKLCYYCYGKSKSGVLGSSSKAQGYDDRFDRIDAIGSLKRGDLVCFDTVDDDDLSDHVGIYIGGGYFIHASSTAKKVILSTLNSGYYNRTFSWGRRIFNS